MPRKEANQHKATERTPSGVAFMVQACQHVILTAMLTVIPTEGSLMAASTTSKVSKELLGQVAAPAKITWRQTQIQYKNKYKERHKYKCKQKYKCKYKWQNK